MSPYRHTEAGFPGRAAAPSRVLNRSPSPSRPAPCRQRWEDVGLARLQPSVCGTHLPGLLGERPTLPQAGREPSPTEPLLREPRLPREPEKRGGSGQGTSGWAGALPRPPPGQTELFLVVLCVTEIMLRVLLKRWPFEKESHRKLRNASSRAFQGWLAEPHGFRSCCSSDSFRQQLPDQILSLQ